MTIKSQSSSICPLTPHALWFPDDTFLVQNVMIQFTPDISCWNVDKPSKWSNCWRDPAKWSCGWSAFRSMPSKATSDRRIVTFSSDWPWRCHRPWPTSSCARCTSCRWRTRNTPSASAPGLCTAGAASAVRPGDPRKTPTRTREKGRRPQVRVLRVRICGDWRRTRTRPSRGWASPRCWCCCCCSGWASSATFWPWRTSSWPLCYKELFCFSRLECDWLKNPSHSFVGLKRRSRGFFLRSETFRVGGVWDDDECSHSLTQYAGGSI